MKSQGDQGQATEMAALERMPRQAESKAAPAKQGKKAGKKGGKLE
jgi:hypothetical protein